MLDPEEGWTAVRFPPVSRLGATRFVSGDPDGDRLRVRYYRRDSDGSLTGKVWFGPGTEGPPGRAHGGAVAAVLDEAMSAAAWLNGHKIVVARVTAELRRTIPVDTVAVFETEVTRVEGKKVIVEAVLKDGEGRTLARGESLLVILGAERFEEWDGEIEPEEVG
jgi:acyl-coenzyme A thioesterase PaaI-like protein